MNFSEFKKRLWADPSNQDPEFLRARHSAPEFERAAEEADIFERKLRAALNVPVDDALPENLLQRVTSAPTRRRPPRWMALAASVVLVAGAASVIWLQSRPPKDVHAYVAQHLSHDGANLMEKATSNPGTGDLRDILARFDMGATPQLADRVRLVKFCPTPDGRGAHMILATPTGLVHLIYLPKTSVIDGEEFQSNGLLTHLVLLEKGSAAIVGANPKSINGLDRLVRNGIIPIESEA
jgi:hypothetical protein